MHILLKILESTGYLLQDPDIDVRIAALNTVGEFGQITIPSNIWDYLIKSIQDNDYRIRLKTIEILSKLKKIIPLDFLESLTSLFQHCDCNILDDVVQAISQIGPNAITPKIIENFPYLLRHSDHNVRLTASKAIVNLGQAAATPAILQSLVSLLEDEYWHIRANVIEAIKELQSITPEFLQSLIKLLQHENFDLRWSATSALQKLGKLASTPEVLKYIESVLEDCKSYNSYDCIRALKIVQTLGSSANFPNIIHKLENLLDHINPDVRSDAIIAISKLGLGSISLKMQQSIIKLVYDSDLSVRIAAIEAIKDSEAVISPIFLESLVALLHHSDHHVRSNAITAISKLGGTYLTSEILQSLDSLLNDLNPEVRLSAINAFGYLLSH